VGTVRVRAVLIRYQTPLLLIAALAVITICGSLSGLQEFRLTLSEMLIQVVVVVGIYVFIGNSGIISFGHIGFMCVGAYAAAWASAQPSFKKIMLHGLPVLLQQRQFPFPVAIAGSVILPVAVALAIGPVIARLPGTAASIATFAFLIIVNSVYSNWNSVTAGVGSIIGIPTLVGPWTAFTFATVAILVAHFYQTSTVGILLRASREDEFAARASGVNTKRMRFIAFVLSAALVGAGGGLYALLLGFVTVDSFYLNLTFISIAMLVVGGISSLTGAVAGVVIVTAIAQLFQSLEQGVAIGALALKLPEGSEELALGILLALILIFRPKGLIGGHEVRLLRPDATSSLLRA
jgi:branched-chain amino acid transport system permease protein